MTDVDQNAQQTRNLILETAEAHLRRYGYARTTVVEIARACGMSHANVYRFFETKAALIDAVTRRWLMNIEQPLQKIPKRSISAERQLEAFVLEFHQLKRAKLTTDVELFEVHSAIMQEHHAVVEQHIQVLFAIIKQILEQGVQTGAFQIRDIQQATLAVWNATLKFHHPLLVAEAINEPTEAQAQTVVKILVAGLATGCI
jgi:AcrR family transcriptional regulator